MSVRCSHCGEELMGAVNRCWRCGRAFTATPTVSASPPVRRRPVDGPLDVPPWIAANLVVAQIVEAPESLDAPVLAETGDSALANASATPEPARRGSPFPDGHVPRRTSRLGRRVLATVGLFASSVKRRLTFRTAPGGSDTTDARPPDEDGLSMPTVSCIVGLTLGVVSLALLGFPMLSVLIGVLGLAFAAVGLAGRSFGIVIVALLVCCLSTGIGVYRFSIQTYEAIYGPTESSEDEDLMFEPTEPE